MRTTSLDRHSDYHLIRQLQLIRKCRLPSSGIHFKLFYPYQNRTMQQSPFLVFRIRDKLHKSPLSINSLKTLVLRVEEMVSLAFWLSRGRIPLSEYEITEIPTNIFTETGLLVIALLAKSCKNRLKGVKSSMEWKI